MEVLMQGGVQEQHLVLLLCGQMSPCFTLFSGTMDDEDEKDHLIISERWKELYVHVKGTIDAEVHVF